MLECILHGKADVVYGSRFIASQNPLNPKWHTLANRFLTWCSNIASGLKLTDEETCYKMFRREVFQRIEIEENGFGVEPEITAKLSRLGARVGEVPIMYHRRTRANGKKLRLIRDGLGAIRCIAQYNLFR
jgi:hypothetical protein